MAKTASKLTPEAYGCPIGRVAYLARFVFCILSIVPQTPIVGRESPENWSFGYLNDLWANHIP
jgi:hypothetical protein